MLPRRAARGGAVKHQFVIPGRMPGLNEIIGVARANRFASASQKHKWTAVCAKAAREAAIPAIARPVRVRICWFEPNVRRDPDNIEAAVKFILDGLVEAGILEDDGQKNIIDITHVVAPDKANPRVVVELEEV